MDELEDDLRCVMLVGHDMPTCAVARFTFDAPSWSAAVSQTPVTAVLDYPKKG